jgi:hypothetical protein
MKRNPDQAHLFATDIRKVCLNSMCDEVAVNCPLKETCCRNCGHYLVRINEKTWQKKYKDSPIIVDYATGEILSAS